MDKAKLNYIVDLGLIVSFLGVFITGIVKFPGLLQSLGVDVKNLPWREISKVHDWSGLVMGILVFVHLVIHWNWIVCMTKKYFSIKKEKKCD
jgi:hypothetical protein